MYDPNPRDPARNLLFGLLAFQNNFIDRAALLAAFADWTADGSRPLGRILADRGAISGDLLGLIDGLAFAHLARHDGRPEKSLAALTPLGTLRDELETRLDPEARLTLAYLSPCGGSPEHGDTNGRPGSAGLPSSAGVRFRILRPLSQGGMGVVSVALDAELDRSVALKEIRAAAAHNGEYRARFLAEAEITGKLEHPGIIPIYGLGAYGDGRPFYAMRLIRGDKTGSLMDAIRRFHAEPDAPGRVVEFRGLLRRFLDVCNALAYAHSKGVLHRDLKPENVLLGPYGETLVVDWGLAKAAGRDDPPPASDGGEHVRLNLSGSELRPTMLGSAFGTPGYAPPEQMTGDLPNVGPRSDVYGLGAILYCLMTGQAPFLRKGLDFGQLIKKVEAGDFTPPRQLRPEVEKPLEAICLKAMARRPDDRYGAASALARDVESYLADEPVSAYREPWSTRARRWTRRHRTAVTASVAALVVGVVGLVAIAAVQTKARGDLAAKNRDLLSARNDLAGKNRDLEVANTSLDRQRRRAEDREARAIEAVMRFREAVANEPGLKNTPALDGLRKKLLKEPLAFFRALRDALQADRDTRPESLVRLAQASNNLGDLTREIGGKRDALIAYREAATISQKLADAHPAAVEYQKLLANSINNVANVLGTTGEPVEALKAYERSLEVRRKLADAHPEVAEFQADLAVTYGNTCILLMGIGRPEDALKACQAALKIRRKLADAHPKVVRAQSDLANSYNNLGVLLGQAEKMPEALDAWTSALEIRRKLADANPNAVEIQGELASSYSNIGILMDKVGKIPEAMKAHEAAMKIRRKLADANPSVIMFQFDLARSYNNLGSVLSADHPDDAMTAYESALVIHRKLALEHPESPDFASDLGGALHNAAMIELRSERYEEARARLRQAIEWQRKALASNPSHPTYRQFMDNHLNKLIMAARGLDDAEGVAEAERELARHRGSSPAVAALDARLAAVIKGGETPGENRERLALAQRAFEKTKYASAARLWGEALAADPKLGDDRQAQHPYKAACAASLAGCGRGNDEPRPDEAERAKLRGRARAWLKDELAAWSGIAPGNNEVVAEVLARWKQDDDLAGIREEKGLAKLTEAERKEWQALWGEVDGLLAKVSAK